MIVQITEEGERVVPDEAIPVDNEPSYCMDYDDEDMKHDPELQ